MNTREQILDQIEAFLAEGQMKKTAFGIAVANDPGFVDRVRAGADFRTQTADRIQAFIQQKTAA